MQEALVRPLCPKGSKLDLKETLCSTWGKVTQEAVVRPLCPKGSKLDLKETPCQMKGGRRLLTKVFFQSNGMSSRSLWSNGMSNRSLWHSHLAEIVTSGRQRPGSGTEGEQKQRQQGRLNLKKADFLLVMQAMHLLQKLFVRRQDLRALLCHQSCQKALRAQHLQRLRNPGRHLGRAQRQPNLDRSRRSRQMQTASG